MTDFHLSNDLTIETVPDVWDSFQPRLKDVAAVKVEFLNPVKVDTAGLAMIIEMAGFARRKNLPFCLINPPKQLIELAKISQTDKILVQNCD